MVDWEKNLLQTCPTYQASLEGAGHVSEMTEVSAYLVVDSNVAQAARNSINGSLFLTRYGKHT